VRLGIRKARGWLRECGREANRVRDSSLGAVGADWAFYMLLITEKPSYLPELFTAPFIELKITGQCCMRVLQELDIEEYIPHAFRIPLCLLYTRQRASRET
jgi:hypothetical protein